MKKLYALITCLIFSLNYGQTFYSENIGTPSANTSVAIYAGWQNASPISYTGTGSARTSTPSTGYSGASGSGNVFLTGTAGTNLIISGLNSSSYSASDIQLSFGYLTNNISTQLVVEYSTNGTDWTPITFAQNTTNNVWNLVTIPGGQVPSSATLSLKFTQPATAQMRIDDIKLASVSASCTLALGTPVASCDNSTLALDTYSVSIPFTGGANATYVITTAGTISGDDPTTTASGNIVVTYTENTNYYVTVIGGTCNLNVNGNSPECKPINTLPFNESFPYTVGNSLNSEQKWTIANSGDNISIESGNLNYTGITSSGNSITFSGAGAESRTPFTNVTSGSIYASFLITASDLSNITTDLTNTYFALFTNNTGASTNARIWIRKNGTQYQFGLGIASVASDWDPSLYNANDIQYLVLGYEFATNKLSLYVNPEIGGSNIDPTVFVYSASPLTSVGGFMLRQDDVNITPTLIIDELTVDFAPNFTLSTSAFNSIDGLTMYPNPVSGGTLNLISTANAMSVQIFDLLGKEVLNSNVINNSADVTKLTAGVYVVKITEEGKTATRKLVVK